MLATQRRPSPISLDNSSSTSTASSSGIESDCDTPGLLSLYDSTAYASTETENETPPETPLRPITVSSSISSHASQSDDKGNSSSITAPSLLEDHIPILLSTTPLILKDEGYWRDAFPQEDFEPDLGYEAEGEVEGGRSAHHHHHYHHGHRRSGSRPKYSRADSSIWSSRRRLQFGKLTLDDPPAVAARKAEETDGCVSGTVTPRGDSERPTVTPLGSQAPTPTATPKLSGTSDGSLVEESQRQSAQPDPDEPVTAAATSTAMPGPSLPPWRQPRIGMAGLGLGLPSRLSSTNVSPLADTIDSQAGVTLKRDLLGDGSGARIHSAPACMPLPSTPVITSTPRFDSPIHKDAWNTLQTPVEEIPTATCVMPSPPSSPPPPPKARILPTVMAQIPSPLELPGSHLDGAAPSVPLPATPKRISSLDPRRRPSLTPRRTTSLTLLCRGDVNTDTSDPSSPFYSPIPPSLLGSPRLQQSTFSPSGKTASPTTRRRMSSVSAYATQLHEKREALGRKTSMNLKLSTRTTGNINPPAKDNPAPPGFIALPLSPEMPSARDLLASPAQVPRRLRLGSFGPKMPAVAVGERNPYFP